MRLHKCAPAVRDPHDAALGEVLQGFAHGMAIDIEVAGKLRLGLQLASR